MLAPHGVEGVAVDGLGAEVTAVHGHAQDVHLHTRAARTVARAHVLTRHDLKHKEGEPISPCLCVGLAVCLSTCLPASLSPCLPVCLSARSV